MFECTPYGIMMIPFNRVHVIEIILVAISAWWWVLRSTGSSDLLDNDSSRSLSAFSNGWWPRNNLFTLVWVFLLLRLVLGYIGNINVGVNRRFGVAIGKNGRRLGFLERWYVAHSRSGSQPGFSLALLIDSSTTQVVNVNEIRLILRRVSCRFPWLRVGVRRDGINGVDSTHALKPVGNNEATGQQSWLWGDDLYVDVQDGLNDTDYFEIKEVTFPSLDDRHLTRILEQESREEWQDENPTTKLWRVVVLRSTNKKKSFYLVLSFHHLITDGLGAVKVVKAILEESQVHASSSSTCTNEFISRDNELSPPLEDIIDTKPRLYHMLLPVVLDRFPSLASFLQPSHWQGLPQHNGDSSRRQCRMACLRLGDEAFVQKLRTLCQQKKLTVNSFATTLLCRAVAQHIARNLDRFRLQSGGILEGGKMVRFRVQQAVNLRPAAFAGRSKHLGCYLCGPQVYISIRPDDYEVDIAAAQYQKRLKAAIPGACMDLGLCRFISEDWIEFSRKYERSVPNGRGDSIDVSNLGAVLRDESGTNKGELASNPSPGWILRGLWFAQGVRSSGPVLRVSMVSAPGGMNAVMASVPDALALTDLEEIGKSWKAELTAAVEGLSVSNTKR